MMPLVKLVQICCQKNCTEIKISLRSKIYSKLPLSNLGFREAYDYVVCIYI